MSQPTPRRPTPIATTRRLFRLTCASTGKAKQAAYQNGADLFGDELSGRFSHEMAEGEYRMVGQRVIVTVTDKHWLLPWPLVEARLRELAS